MLKLSRRQGWRFPMCKLAALAMVLAGALALAAPMASAQTYNQDPNFTQGTPPPTFSSSEIINAGHSFFGTVSRNLANVVERLFAQYGRPNGYILGEELSGAFVGGLRYGEGVLYTKNAGERKVFWQGPSIGFDYGGEGARTMVLVYNLDTVDQIYRRYAAVSGSAFVVGGLGVAAMANGPVRAVPIRSGVGARLGANIGYIKFTDAPTWNPF